MLKHNLPDFTGKLVVFYTVNAPSAIQDGIVLEHASFTEYGDRLFVVGRISSAEDGLEWASGLQAGLAWDHVTHFLILDSREDFLKRLDHFSRALRDKESREELGI
jgi:hypothetical protein